MDKFQLDGHKLQYHVPRVNDWLAGKIVYPIYVEISPSGMCNHRCTFCALDFMNYQKRFLDTQLINGRIAEMAKLGIKSIMFAGEGEPLLHPNIAEIIQHTRAVGIDVALTTNGVHLNEKLAQKVLGDIDWVKISIDAGTKGTYAHVHGTRVADFDVVLHNIASLVQLKTKHSYRCAIGMQMLLVSDNHHEAVTLAQLARNVGVDYLVIKPYSQHERSSNERYQSVQYSDYYYLKDELEQFNTPDFNVIMRVDTMQQWDERERGFERCMAHPFWAYIDAGGNVWACIAHLGNEQFRFGNICEHTFEEVWNGEKRLEFLDWVAHELDVSQCRLNCRMDKVNRYLGELKRPPAHVNFI